MNSANRVEQLVHLVSIGAALLPASHLVWLTCCTRLGPAQAFFLWFWVHERSNVYVSWVSANCTAGHAHIVVLLATDPDREGEAISWHITQELL
eukprot:scaffold110460_cov19-Tisochrysis_lutea.AAC.1